MTIQASGMGETYSIEWFDGSQSLKLRRGPWVATWKSHLFFDVKTDYICIYDCIYEYIAVCAAEGTPLQFTNDRPPERKRTLWQRILRGTP